jgi:hypothetical protein
MNCFHHGLCFAAYGILRLARRSQYYPASGRDAAGKKE